MTIKDLLSLRSRADQDLRAAEGASRRAGAKAKTARARYQTAKLAANRTKRSAKAARKLAKRATREAERMLAVVLEQRDKVARLVKKAAGISAKASTTTRPTKSRRPSATRVRVSVKPQAIIRPKRKASQTMRQARMSPAIKSKTKVAPAAITKSATAPTIPRSRTPSSPVVTEVPAVAGVVAGQIPVSPQSVESVAPVG